ncbi:MAG TPA: nucleoid occlusion protein [Firmicutes bacterium]|mgnify:CR=1 FL=1|jgi:ParB family chromosome partitioning protein|nr:nucleoid occlusion protein [Bacillota bacterium]
MKEHWGRIWGTRDENKKGEAEQIINVPIASIVSNPYQPRKTFEQEKIRELAQSIKTYGLLQPIILTKTDNGYQIAAGERRYQACLFLGWQEISAIVREYQDSTLAAVALIENLQRENLSFIEEAEGYRRLIDEFNLTQEVLAQRLGKSQSTIANKLRILKLPQGILEKLKKEKLTERHARSLLRLESHEKQKEALEIIIEKELNVRSTDLLVDQFVTKDNKKKKKNVPFKKAVIKDMRIFLNTIRQAVQIIERAGLFPEVDETDGDNFWEIRIRLPKRDTTI